MNITLKSKNVALSGSMKAYIENKIVLSIRKALGGADTGAVLLDIEVGKASRHHRKGLVWEAEATLQKGKNVLRGEAQGELFQEAVDLLEEELVREVKKWKERRSATARRGERRAKRNATVAKAARFHRKGRIREEGL